MLQSKLGGKYHSCQGLSSQSIRVIPMRRLCRAPITTRRVTCSKLSTLLCCRSLAKGLTNAQHLPTCLLAQHKPRASCTYSCAGCNVCAYYYTVEHGFGSARSTPKRSYRLHCLCMRVMYWPCVCDLYAESERGIAG